MIEVSQNSSPTNTRAPSAARLDQRVHSLAAFSTQRKSSDPRHSFSLLRILGLMSLFASVRASLFPAQIELAGLKGPDGLMLRGERFEDNSGFIVANAGDVNGDGKADFLIGAPQRASRPGFISPDLGKTYVVFGGSWLTNVNIVDLARLNGVNGFVITGEFSGSLTGISASGAGDVNGDGIDDIIIGGIRAGQGGSGYVLFGSTMIGNKGSINLKEEKLNGSNGFRIVGEAGGNEAGCSVSGAGDMNGDKIDDLIIGARNAKFRSRNDAGRSYVLFGKKGLGGSGIIHLSNLSDGQGLMLNGTIGKEQSGTAVSGAGDVNNDGLADVIIGSREFPAGKSHVVFGKRTLPDVKSINLNSLSGDDGFTVRGHLAGDALGFSVSGAGDVNGDDVDDLIIGAPEAPPDRAGRSYVLFGRKGIGAGGSIDLTTLEPKYRLVIDGEEADDWSGFPVSSAGDVNGDGVSDLIIGAMGADPGRRKDAGRSYVLFGKEGIGGTNGRIDLANLSAEDGFVLNGEDFDTTTTRANVFTAHGSVSGAGDVNHDGIADLIVGVSWASPEIDRQVESEAGKSYVVFGRSPTPTSIPSISSTITTPLSIPTSDEGLTVGEINAITFGTIGAFAAIFFPIYIHCMKRNLEEINRLAGNSIQNISTSVNGIEEVWREAMRKTGQGKTPNGSEKMEKGLQVVGAAVRGMKGGMVKRRTEVAHRYHPCNWRTVRAQGREGTHEIEEALDLAARAANTILQATKMRSGSSAVLTEWESTAQYEAKSIHGEIQNIKSALLIGGDEVLVGGPGIDSERSDDSLDGSPASSAQRSAASESDDRALDSRPSPKKSQSKGKKVRRKKRVRSARSPQSHSRL